ncbi:MAG: hypothetical protein LBK66_15400 [Spirochaetaceae bacterium]|jgi:hypothetical protein|nr:hypothetical protein [Spirochaetaceae bacterium]
MKKQFLVLFTFFMIFSVNGQDFNLMNGITLNDQNRSKSITVDFKEETEFKSLWDRGRVIRYSNDENNTTGLKRFVEIEYEMGFLFEGYFRNQGMMTIIFSNLKEIDVIETSIISKGTLIGKTKKDVGNDLRIFVLSDNENLSFLNMWTNNNKIKIDNTWYWDPSFLFR